MMIVIQTWAVDVELRGQKFSFRVPETDLDTFLRVLNFNRPASVAYAPEKQNLTDTGGSFTTVGT